MGDTKRLDPSPQPSVVRVALPAEVAYDLDRFQNAIEVEPQTYWRQHQGGADPRDESFAVNAAQLARCRDLARHRLVHSVGFAIGGASDGDPRRLQALRETFDLLQANAHMAARLALLKFGNWWAR